MSYNERFFSIFPPSSRLEIRLLRCLVVLLFGYLVVWLSGGLSGRQYPYIVFYLLMFVIVQSSLPIIVVWIDSESDRKMEQK